MKTVRYLRTLFYYDGPQIFEGRDAIGGHYVAVMAPSNAPEKPFAVEAATGDRYVVVGVAPERLRLFRAGALDLRSLLVGSNKEDRYLTAPIVDFDAPLELEGFSIPFHETGFLPDPDFFLYALPTGDAVLREARERNNLVLELIAEPREAVVQHRIRANTLAEMLLRVQAMVKYAYRTERKGGGYRDTVQEPDMMDVVVPAAAGSFRVVLEAASFPDLFNESSLASALLRIDALFKRTASPPETLSIIRQNRGHFASAYLKLLRFLNESGTGLRYSWAGPNSEAVHNQSVLHKETGPLVEVLSGVEKLGSEPTTLQGAFDKFDRNSGSWALRTREGRVSGGVRKGGPSLDGLEVGGAYRFFCDEEIEEIEITGRESRKLYLNRHEPA